MDFAAMFMKVCTKNGLVFSFMLIGIITLITYKLSGLTKGKVHGSAIAIFAGLVLAYIGGITTFCSDVCRCWHDGRRHVP